MSVFKKWVTPSKRAKSYAAERKAKVHQHGPKEGQELTVYEAGLRSGYLQCQTDHAGIFNYKKYKEAEKAANATKAESTSKPEKKSNK